MWRLNLGLVLRLRFRLSLLKLLRLSMKRKGRCFVFLEIIWAKIFSRFHHVESWESEVRVIIVEEERRSLR